MPLPLRIVAIVTTTATLALCLIGCTPTRAPALVTIRNATTESIATLSLDVSGEHLTTTTIAPGDSVTLRYSLGAESDYHVVAHFSSGQVLEAHAGYVDAGLTTHDYLQIFRDHIAFNPAQPATASGSPANESDDAAEGLSSGSPLPQRL